MRYDAGRSIGTLTMIMKRSTFAVVIVGFVVAGAVAWQYMWPAKPVPVGLATPKPDGGEWINLLDHDHAAGWRNITDAKDLFEIEGDTLHVFGRTWWPLRYVGYGAERFKNFDLHLEYKIAPGANSGVFVRMQPNDPVLRGFEIQILDDFGEPPTKNSSGAIYDVVTPMYNMSRPAGEWNSFDVELIDHHARIIMNGWLVVNADLSKMTTPLGKFKVAYKDLPLEGVIALQDHGGEVWYRNIVLRKR